MVLDLRSRDEGGYILAIDLYVCAVTDETNAILIDSIDYKRDARWLELRDASLSAGLRDWEKDFCYHL